MCGQWTSRIAHQVITIDIRGSRAFKDTETCRIVGKVRSRAGLPTRSGEIIGVPALQAFINTGVGIWLVIHV